MNCNQATYLVYTVSYWCNRWMDGFYLHIYKWILHNTQFFFYTIHNSTQYTILHNTQFFFYTIISSPEHGAFDCHNQHIKCPTPSTHYYLPTQSLILQVNVCSVCTLQRIEGKNLSRISTKITAKIAQWVADLHLGGPWFQFRWWTFIFQRSYLFP